MIKKRLLTLLCVLFLLIAVFPFSVFAVTGDPDVPSAPVAPTGMYELIKSFATSIMGDTFVNNYDWTIALMCVFAMCSLVLPLVRLLTLPLHALMSWLERFLK